MKQWHTITFSAKVDQDDIRALNKCFYDAMKESMEISECADLMIRAEYEESRKEKLTMREVISQSYDGLSEEERQKFCQDMLGRKEFFGATCRMIMDVFVNASEAEKKDASE